MDDAITALGHQPAVTGQPVIDPADWTRTDLEKRNDWIFRLSDAEIADIDAAVHLVERGGLHIMIGHSWLQHSSGLVVIWGARYHKTLRGMC